MPKRRVQFADDATESNSTMEESAKRFKEKHSLDSDDDDGEEEVQIRKEDNRLTEDDIEGQEEETIRFDDGVRVTPFNLKEEMEEGHFDAEGNYIPDKDAGDIHDEWLDSVNWERVSDYAARAKEKEDEEMDDEGQFEKSKCLKEMIKLLHPGETILAAIRRLGGKGKASGVDKRWKRNKKEQGNSASTQGSVETQETEKNHDLLLRLTELADRMLSEGDFEIYQKTYEKLNFEIKVLEETFEDADEDDELESAFNASAKQSPGQTSRDVLDATAKDLLSDGVMWEYKWEKGEKNTIFGPFTSQQMLDWSEQGFFDQGVLCRKVGSAGDFYNSRRIDFDLYV